MGNVFVALDSERFGGRLALGLSRQISYDLKALLTEALERTAAQSLLSPNVDDYEIADFSIG